MTTANPTKDLTKTTYLGAEWFANEWSDGSMTIRNSEKGQRIDLPVDSVKRLREICAALPA